MWDSGWVPPETNVEDFEFAIRTVCEPIFEKPLADISFGHVLLNLFNTARRFNMEVQPQLVLLQKTLLYVEGLGRQLYPQLDLWKTAKPFLENWIKDQVGIPPSWRALKEKAPFWAEKLPELPELIYDGFKQHKLLQKSVDKLAVEFKEQRGKTGTGTVFVRYRRDIAAQRDFSVIARERDVIFSRLVDGSRYCKLDSRLETHGINSVHPGLRR